MAFKLTHIRTGEEKYFSIREILELLGDPINDEIKIHGQEYRIANVKTDLTNTGIENNIKIKWIKTLLPVSYAGQNEFNATINIENPENVFLIINGVIYNYGENYHFDISKKTIIWHGSFNIEPTDLIYIKYLIIIN